MKYDKNHIKEKSMKQRLEQLTVKSFITSLDEKEAQKIKGGATSPCASEPCPNNGDADDIAG
jgi:hypothetical protein